MKRILFACYGGFDFDMIAPLFPLLRGRGIDAAVLNRYSHTPSARQLKGLKVYSPPTLLQAPEGAVAQRVLRHLDASSIGPWLDSLKSYLGGLGAVLSGLDDHYCDFVLETICEYDPDLVVVSAGEAETVIAKQACRAMGMRYACLLPQRYEFKSLETFKAQDEGAAYLVAGEYGKSRLIRHGVRADQILVTGNPRFDRWRGFKRAPRAPVKTILFPLQGVPYDERLFGQLERYLSSRREVSLRLRPHPYLPAGAYPWVARRARGHVISAGTLKGWMSGGDALVSLWSLTVLEALAAGLPVISWKSDFLPQELPFAAQGDVLAVRDYAELERALDRLLFDDDFKASWLREHRNAHVRYLGELDGNAALRVAQALEKLASGRSPAEIPG